MIKKPKTSPREAFAATASEAVLEASVAASERANKERRATRKPPNADGDGDDDDSDGRTLHLDKRAGMLLANAPEGSDDELLTSQQLANWLGTSRQWVELGRAKGYGPPFVKLAPCVVRYKRSAIVEWLSKREHKSTAEYA